MPSSANKGWAGKPPPDRVSWGETPLVSLVAELDEPRRAHGDLSGLACGASCSTVRLAGKTALVSSFGADRAPMLGITIPVLFVGTRRLFAKTHVYRETLVLASRPGNVGVVRADATRGSAGRSPAGVLR